MQVAGFSFIANKADLKPNKMTLQTTHLYLMFKVEIRECVKICRAQNRQPV